MSDRYPGGVLSTEGATASLTSATGMWTLAQQLGYKALNVWPLSSVFVTQTFTATGTSSFKAPAGVTSIEYLVVAGGGSGGSAGNGNGGGGGAGGFRTGTATVSPGTEYQITVGGGGTPSSAGGGNSGNDGSNSQIDGIGPITSTGGGGGGAGNNGDGSTLFSGRNRS